MAKSVQRSASHNPLDSYPKKVSSVGTTTKDLALPIRKLISDGALKTKGEKRSTTYFAGESKKKKN